MIVLDTHVLIWWVSNPEKLSKNAAKYIQRDLKKGEVLVSSISTWEICLLVQKGKLTLAMNLNSWISQLEQLPLHFIPVDNHIAKQSVFLPGNFHPDPADRMIVATALEYGATLITSDQKILKYKPVRAVW